MKSTLPAPRAGFLVSAGIGVGFLLFAGLLTGPSPDSAIFTVVGDGIVRGDMPYRDLWDHKPPGVYLVAALAALMPGSSWGWLWGASVAATVAAGYLLWPLTNRWTALLAALGMAVYPAALGGGLTEPFGAVPAVAALLLATRGRYVWAGVAVAVALLFSIQYLPELLALAILAPRAVPRGIAGALFVVAAGAAWLGDTLPAALDALLRYHIAYGALDRTSDLDNLPGLLLLLLPLTVLAILRGSGLRRLDLAAAAWLLVGVVLVMIQGRLFAHYAVPLLIPLAILAARGVRRLGSSRAWALPGLVIIYVGWAQAAAIAAGDGNLAERGVAVWLQDHARPGDQLLAWGHEADIYLESGLDPAGRFLYLMPLVTPGYSTAAQVDAWVTSLRADPPAFIVDSEAANPYWTGDDFLRPPPPGAAGGRDLDLLDPLRAFVTERYKLAAVVNDREIWALR